LIFFVIIAWFGCFELVVLDLLHHISCHNSLGLVGLCSLPSQFSRDHGGLGSVVWEATCAYVFTLVWCSIASLGVRNSKRGDAFEELS